jgi:DNA/RNA endonuclease YhcR with UshA esterase domain
MKRSVGFASLIGFLVLTFAVPVKAQKKFPASEAKDHYGETATVCGEVVSTRYADSTKGQPTFLNLDKPYPGQVFTVVIWGNNRSKFGTPENDYKGKRICVTGKITAYAGLPEIVADEPKQIRIDAEK